MGVLLIQRKKRLLNILNKDKFPSLTATCMEFSPRTIKAFSTLKYLVNKVSLVELQYHKSSKRSGWWVQGVGKRYRSEWTCYGLLGHQTAHHRHLSGFIYSEQPFITHSIQQFVHPFRIIQGFPAYPWSLQGSSLSRGRVWHAYTECLT